MSENYIEIAGWTKFEEKFKPKTNHFGTAPNNQYYQTHGKEGDYVRTLDPRYVWTNVQGESSDLLLNGFHLVNRIAYIVCENPWGENTSYEVLISEEVECDCYIEEGYDDGDSDGDPDCELCEGYGYKQVYPE